MPNRVFYRAHLFAPSPAPTPGSVLLLSDLHFDYQTPARAAAMQAVVGQVFGKASAVLILGDIGDGVQHTDCRRFMERLCGGVLRALRQHQARGVAPLYVPGNHDGWFRQNDMDWPAFAVRSTGGEAPVRLTLLGKTLRLSHGDEFDATEDDPLMQQLHHTLNETPLLRLGRNALNQVVRQVRVTVYEMDYFLWGNTHALAEGLKDIVPDLSRSLARRVAWAQRRPGALVHNLHVWEDAARRLMRQEKPDLLVMGHTHVPVLEQLDRGIHLNTGDWSEHAVVSWMDKKGVYQQDLSHEAKARFLPWPVGL